MKASESAPEILQIFQNAHTIFLLSCERVGGKKKTRHFFDRDGYHPLTIPSREPNRECGILQRHYRMTLKRNESSEAHPVPDERLACCMTAQYHIKCNCEAVFGLEGNF